MAANQIDHLKVAKSLQASDIDLLLILVGLNIMKSFGHRYGTFIEAFSNAAKFVVYLTYLEQGQNLRRTGFIHHVEPRRVKSIVQEFEQIIQSGSPLKFIGDSEPHYLIGISHLWKQSYPKTGENCCRFKNFSLSTPEKLLMESRISKEIPECLAITECQLRELVFKLHEETQEYLASAKRVEFSDALAEHAKFRLLDAGTVEEVKLANGRVAYVLVKNEYSPKGKQARRQTMVQDLSRCFKFLYLWVEEDPGIMRGIETLSIKTAKRQDALADLDKLVREWADKYHVEDGEYPLALQFLAGPYEEV